MKIKHIDHINLSVRNLEASLAWYARVFDFEVVERGVQDGRPWAIARSGEAMLALYEDAQRTHHDRFSLRRKKLHGINHFALRVDDPQAWLERAAAESVPVLYEGEVAWPHSSSWYVVDPTGYEIEVVHWHAGTIAFSPHAA